MPDHHAKVLSMLLKVSFDSYSAHCDPRLGERYIVKRKINCAFLVLGSK